MQFNLPLTKNNFILFAVKYYTNPQCLGVDEFNSDLKRLSYIKRLLRKVKRGKDIDNRLLINHIVCLSNLFNTTPLNRLLFFYCEKDSYPVLVSILSYLSILDEHIPELKQFNKIKSDHKMDKYLESI